ncbi:MAG TPA: hypothetical protein VM940_00250 [Chthoniobacterales bacterium]|jgi:hypothetical protein|nr:hypothetical protein [Chthoniobacterales bacterium]
MIQDIPNIDVVIDIRVTGVEGLTLKTPKGAKFGWVQYYKTTFETLKFTTNLPSVTAMISSERIQFSTSGGEGKDQITAEFFFFAIQMADMANNPTLEIDLDKNPFCLDKTASLEISAQNLRTSQQFRQVRQNIKYGISQIDVLSNFP